MKNRHKSLSFFRIAQLSSSLNENVLQSFLNKAHVKNRIILARIDEYIKRTVRGNRCKNV